MTTSNYLSLPSGNEQPFSSAMATSAFVTLVTGGNNGARVTVIRAAEVGGGTPTLRLDILNAAATSAVQIRGAKALAAHEVYKDFDVRLLRGEALRAQASTSNSVNISGLYVENPRGPGTV